MFCAIPGGSAGNNLSALGYKASERAYVLVIDYEGLVSAEPANLAPSAWAPPAPGPALAIATTALGPRLF
jgi:hypothetical protein